MTQTDPRWQAWAEGKSRCPYCVGLPEADFKSVCDCWQYEREFGERTFPDDPTPTGVVFE